MLIEHVGRRTGRPRRTVVEVVWRFSPEPLRSEEGGQIMARYADRHPLAACELCHLMRRPVHDGDYAAVGKEIPFLALQPA